MTFAHNWDLYFHMINHYKKIKNAKPVVDSSPPKGYNGNSQENKSRCLPPTCPAARAPRSCSPECPRNKLAYPHRSQYHQRCVSAPQSCPWKPCWKGRSPCRHRTLLEDGIEPATKVHLFRQYLDKPGNANKMDESNENGEEDKGSANQPKVISVIKAPVNGKDNGGQSGGTGRRTSGNETPVSVIMSPNKELFLNNSFSEVKDHEYVYFLLKITEDILRNNIYMEDEMEKLFESHIEANKGRLDEIRMRQQIEQLRKELSLPLAKNVGDCDCHESEPQSVQHDCKCCPAYNADGTTNLEELCECTNPNCPKNTKPEPAIKEAEDVKPPVETKERDSVISAERAGGGAPQIVSSSTEKDDDNCGCLEGDENDSKDCRCCPAFQNETCPCDNPVCPVNKPKVGATVAKASSEVPCICEDDEPSEQPETTKVGAGEEAELPPPEAPELTGERVGEEKRQEEAKPPTESVEKPEDGKDRSSTADAIKTDCVDPIGCSNGYSKSFHSSRGTSALTCKIKSLNTEDAKSQIVMYNDLESETDRCFCTVSLQRKALKIQNENKDEEYILVDGPVCMPRSMLEKKTIPILIQNVPSAILRTNGREDKRDGSRVNLFQQFSQVEQDKNSNMDSISGYIQPGRDGDYDLMPEREIKRGESDVAPKYSSPKGSFPKTASFYGDVLTTISADDSDEERAETTPTSSAKICGPCGGPRTSCTPRSQQGNKRKEECSRARPKPEQMSLQGSQMFEVTTKDEDLIPTIPEIPETVSVDSTRKYHYLLVDVATSTSTFVPTEKEKVPVVEKPIEAPIEEAIEEPIAESIEETIEEMNDESIEELIHSEESLSLEKLSILSEDTSKENIQQEFKLLMDEEYETEPDEEPELLKDDAPETQESQEEVSSLGRLSEASIELHAVTSHEKVDPEKSPTRKLSESDKPKVFQYPTIGEQMKQQEELQKTDSIQERLSIAESYRRGSILTADPEVLRNVVQAVESLTSPLPFQNHPVLKKQSIVNPSASGLRPHEGLKVRYSMTRDFFNPEQQDALKKLEAHGTESKDNLAQINEKMKEFRKVEDDNDANRRFQITNPDHFEIRRVSVSEGQAPSDEEVDKKKKSKGKCCGLGQQSKKKSKGSFSSTDEF